MARKLWEYRGHERLPERAPKTKADWEKILNFIEHLMSSDDSLGHWAIDFVRRNFLHRKGRPLSPEEQDEQDRRDIEAAIALKYKLWADARAKGHKTFTAKKAQDQATQIVSKTSRLSASHIDDGIRHPADYGVSPEFLDSIRARYGFPVRRRRSG
jgi:hypothetical protein